jgi:hypothetical protein
MTIEIINKQSHTKGVLYTIRVNDSIRKLSYLFHEIERIKRWKITEEMVAETLAPTGRSNSWP